MIDFKNGAFFKLKKIDNEKAVSLVSALLISDESIISTYKALRDYVVFTNKRIISVNAQGISGTKKDIHLCHIQRFRFILLKLLV